MNALMDLVKARIGAVVFFGDLNDTPKHQLIRALKVLFSASSSETTGPTHGQRLIDYIMVRGGKIVGASTRRVHSDHRMVIVDASF
jgi:endonuclease/exonuclease/phosphatase (EEP) superfamily protein YafD